ncbi:hypothetical protein NE236_41865 [Actinoallomurus purpureus]|nr:hypothetical protein [Actinoallomurus purpureus]MCO6011518.1 hypothetical protein [Actinoallomurus purpureus]
MGGEHEGAGDFEGVAFGVGAEPAEIRLFGDAVLERAEGRGLRSGAP